MKIWDVILAKLGAAGKLANIEDITSGHVDFTS